MIKSTIAELLHYVEIFKEIDSELLNQVANVLTYKSYNAGTPIIHKGEEKKIKQSE